MARNPITSTVPFDEDGVHHGFLRLPYSHDLSAWGSLMVPICVIRNGDGPTALLTGANHGDEYEGPVALQHTALTLAPQTVSGRVIIVPYFNYPAFRSATRTSPIDKANMNRIFPGKPDGTVSEKIAHYFHEVLVPMADVVLDFHSGGRTLDFIPFAAAHVLDDKAQQARCEAAMEAFAAPYSTLLLEIDNVGMFDSDVEAQGKVFVSTELGGGGTATARSIGIAKRGIHNLLVHSGIVVGEPEAGPSTRLDMPDMDCFVFSENEGLIEPMIDLGEPVEAGATVARIWPMDRTGLAPVVCLAKTDGILAGRHFPGLVTGGDCVAMIAKIAE